MKSALIVHGSMGNPDKHWYPWLKEKLEERELEVFLPQFPIGEGQQTLENWMETIEPMRDKLGNSILIGHSLGVPFIINVLNQIDNKVRAAFLVAGFVGHLEVEGKPNLDDFAVRDFDWNKIKNNCERFYVIHSDNDQYIPLERAEELAQNLETEAILVKGAAHFQTQSGYETFSLLLEKIDEELNHD